MLPDIFSALVVRRLNYRSAPELYMYLLITLVSVVLIYILYMLKISCFIHFIMTFFNQLYLNATKILILSFTVFLDSIILHVNT